jgi:hypothetical protein
MLQINKRYRSNYVGEHIISERVYEDGNWKTTMENVPNAVFNNQISNQAVVFGNGLSRTTFDTKLITNHKGGLLGADKLQTYGCNAMYRDTTLDFLVVTDRTLATELSMSEYINKNIVYTRIVHTLKFPKQFYLIPNDMYADAGSTALYIAAFDGHRKIYLLGFDGQDTPNFNHNIYAGTNGYDAKDFDISDDKWRTNQAMIFALYNEIDFVIVSETGYAPMPESWKYLTNVRPISFANFIIEASL